MTPKTTAEAVRDVLNDADFPMDKQAVVDHASGREHSEATIKALRALPLGTYASVDEVIRSVDSVEAGR